MPISFADGIYIIAMGILLLYYYRIKGWHFTECRRMPLCMFIIQAQVYKIQFFSEGVLMRQFKSVKLIASFKTQKEIKECLKKQEFFETLMQKVNSQFTPDELELLFTLHPHSHSTAPTTQKQSQKQGLGAYRVAAPKKQCSPLEEISFDVFSSAKKRIRKIVTFEKEQGGEQNKHIQRPSISTPKIKRKIINNLICSGDNELKQNKRATSEILKPPPKTVTKKATYKFSRPKYRGANSASKDNRQFLSNPKVLQSYNSQFMDFMFRAKTEQNHSESMAFADSGSTWENYMAGKSEEDKKYRSIERLKVGRHKTLGVRS